MQGERPGRGSYGQRRDGACVSVRVCAQEAAAPWVKQVLKTAEGAAVHTARDSSLDAIARRPSESERAQEDVVQAVKLVPTAIGHGLKRVHSMAVSSTRRFDDLNNEMRSRSGTVRPPLAEPRMVSGMDGFWMAAGFDQARHWFVPLPDYLVPWRVQMKSEETRHATFNDKVSYYVENTLTASPYMQIVFLGIVVGLIIIVFGFIYNGGEYQLRETEATRETQSSLVSTPTPTRCRALD